MKKLPDANNIGTHKVPMREVFRWVTEGLTLKACAERAGCTLYALNAKIKKYPSYGRRLEEARRLAAETHLQSAMDALDIEDATLDLHENPTAVVALRKAKSELHMKLAKVADRERLSDMVKPTAPTPTMIIAINGVDMISRKSVVQDIEFAQRDVDDSIPMEALTLASVQE